MFLLIYKVHKLLLSQLLIMTLQPISLRCIWI